MNQISLGFSPCPNDTFIFYALSSGLIDTRGIDFIERIEDVQSLNELALKRELGVTKLSFATFGHLGQDYALLRSGAAIGRGVGPLIISKEALDPNELEGKRIAAPGKNTTASLLLKLFNPALGEPIWMPFDKIMEAVKSGQVDAGVIIHESRFLFTELGLFEVLDLGKWWEAKTDLPLPLGGIFAKKSLGERLIGSIEQIIRESLEYALEDRNRPMDYIRRHASELDDEVIKAHIGLYVNDFSLNLGEEGIETIGLLLKMGREAGFFNPPG